MFTMQEVFAVEVVEYFRTRPLITEPDAQHKYQLSGEGENAVYQCGLNLAAGNTSERWDLCPGRSPQCSMLCLESAGQNLWPSSKLARHLRTRLLMEHPEVFREYLDRDLAKARAKAKKLNLRFVFRFNTLSDADVMKICVGLVDVDDQWMDYTKIAGKYRAWLLDGHPNYHLTFSRSELNHAQCLEFLKMGGTVTIVVADDTCKQAMLRGSYYGFPSVDGDLHDRRWEDPAGHWIVLVAKGKARKAKHGPKQFVVSWSSWYEGRAA